MAPQPFLNLKINRKIGDKSNFSLSARNLLSAQNRWYYPFNDKEYNFRNFNYAPQFNLGVQILL